MTQVCGKGGTKEDTKNIRASIEGHQNRFQGDIGESVAADYVVNTLELNAEFFDKRLHGIDGVYRDGNGKLVLTEDKFTVASGLASLGHTKHGREGSVEWVTYKATLMCDRSSSFYTPDNAKIGEEILSIGAENITFLVIHTDPNTLETDVAKLR